MKHSFYDEDKWITVHPNGEDAKGSPVLLDDDTGVVKAGMGGKFNGQKLNQARSSKSAPKQKNAPARKESASAEKESAIKSATAKSSRDFEKATEKPSETPKSNASTKELRKSFDKYFEKKDDWYSDSDKFYFGVRNLPDGTFLDTGNQFGVYEKRGGKWYLHERGNNKSEPVEFHEPSIEDVDRGDEIYLGIGKSAEEATKNMRGTKATRPNDFFGNPRRATVKNLGRTDKNEEHPWVSEKNTVGEVVTQNRSYNYGAIVEKNGEIYAQLDFARMGTPKTLDDGKKMIAIANKAIDAVYRSNSMKGLSDAIKQIEALSTKPFTTKEANALKVEMAKIVKRKRKWDEESKKEAEPKAAPTKSSTPKAPASESKAPAEKPVNVRSSFEKTLGGEKATEKTFKKAIKELPSGTFVVTGNENVFYEKRGDKWFAHDNYEPSDDEPPPKPYEFEPPDWSDVDFGNQMLFGLGNSIEEALKDMRSLKKKPSGMWAGMWDKNGKPR